MNKQIVIGNVGKNPELRYLPSGDPIVTLSIATNEYIGKDKQTGEPRYHTEWHYAAFYKEKAEIVANHVKAGSKMMVVGSTRKSTGNDGKLYIKIRVEEFEFLDSKLKAASTAPQIPPSAIAGEEQEWAVAGGRR
jgi:single stranded DNA-binding protein